MSLKYEPSSEPLHISAEYLFLNKPGNRNKGGGEAEAARGRGTHDPVLSNREARAVPSAFVGEGAALCYAKGISAATGRKRLGRGVSKVDWTITFDFVVK